MALSGLEIYKLLPKTNCKDCGFPTCLAFAMALAAKKTSLNKCPHITAAARAALESAAEPPMRLITLGWGDAKRQIGNETEMFRHEKTFYNPTIIAILVEDTLDEKALDGRLDRIAKLSFERVGQRINVDAVAIKNTSGDKTKFIAVLQRASKLPLAIILISGNAGILEEALKICRDKRPLVCGANAANYEAFLKLGREYNVPLSVAADSIEALSDLSEKITAAGFRDIVLDSGTKELRRKIEDLTYCRRMALKKRHKPFGYPQLAFTQSTDPTAEAIEASALVAKYANIVITKALEPSEVLPILTVRQNIYTDPQKPVQVEPKIYEVGSVTKESPVLVTTNFSITYYTVLGEVEASRVPSFLIASDTEGMSVLTAWAAEKFTPESITKTLESLKAGERVSHNNIVIPGYVAVMSGKLEELSGKKVLVGPREASGLVTYLKSLKI